MVFVSILITIGKFTYGFIFGALIWSIVVQPYLVYYDFTNGSYGPMSVFATLVASLFVWSSVIRSILLLYLPGMVGSATQNYVMMLLFSSMLLNPVTNIGLNAIESVRVIGCSLTMTFDQLRERAKLVLNPIVEVLSDKNQTDLDPIKGSLFEIQQLVGKLQRNIDHAVQQTVRLKETSVPGGRGGSGAGGQTTLLEAAVGPNKTRQIESPARPASGNVEFEFDLENFGLKATVDVDQLRALARQGQLRKFLLKGNETLATSQVNISDVLFDSCVAMFRSAKQQCSEAVADMQVQCQKKVGVFLATWWCHPFSIGLERFCPTIMNQLVNENNVCKELKMTDISNIAKGLKFIESHGSRGSNETKKYRDVNEAFRELTQQIGKLNENILSLNDDGDKDRKPTDDSSDNDKQAAAPQERLRRFELSLTFNEKTRRVFQDIKQLIDFISDKYKMRRLFVDLLLLAYDIYTTYTFALILMQTLRYRRDYLTNIKFDNCYITREFVELDRRAHSARRPESSTAKRSTVSTSEGGKKGGGSVLPLTKDESERYISPFTCLRRTREERRLQRASLWTLAMFLIFALSLLYLDNIFYSILTSIQEHSLIRYKEVGHHELDIKVYGDGVIARLVKRLVGNFSSAYKLSRITSTRKCLPNASQTTSAFYVSFLVLLSIYFLIDQLSIYAKRLRAVTCALFYPGRERSRLRYLHRFIRFQRQKLKETGVKNYLISEDEIGSVETNGQKFKEDLEEEDSEAYSLREAAIYVRQCLIRGARRYCSSWNRLLFAPRRSDSKEDANKLVSGTP